ncbi:MAG: flagellum-specific ATP synthase FliI, partial [Gammaproteobacteria bacterium]|nr:flagellum-specific ATP synthase FliI [Gammaproteobacteria bacterium]
VESPPGDAGHYPAVDVEGSISRVMPRVVDSAHLGAAQRFRELWSRYSQQQDLINVGAYVAGTDTLTDKSIKLRSDMVAFLRQGATERATLAASRERLQQLFSQP